ncbi:MAG: PSP1 C-terminal domain-containing protein, partial [Chloroflexi bacterium]|nr:PSP1 C-terminal domain-containing protein [Chloroflexota bacterium]
MDEKPTVGIRFKRAGRVYYFDPAEIELSTNDGVVVVTEHGPSVGRVVVAPKQVLVSERTEPLKAVLRKVTPEDMQCEEDGRQRESEALSRCAELAAKLDLPIQVLDAESNLDG